VTFSSTIHNRREFRRRNSHAVAAGVVDTAKGYWRSRRSFVYRKKGIELAIPYHEKGLLI
jgi:hypothetical protein